MYSEVKKDYKDTEMYFKKLSIEIIDFEKTLPDVDEKIILINWGNRQR